MPLLAALFLGATAAAPSREEVAFREIRALGDRGDWALAEEKAATAIQTFAGKDSDVTHALRVLYGEILINRGQRDLAFEVLSRPLPTRLATSESEVRRLMFRGIVLSRLGRIEEADADLETAKSLATKHQRKSLPTVLVTMSQFGHSRTFPDSERLIREAIRIAKTQKNEPAELKAWSALGRKYTFAERVSESIRMSEPALAREQKLGLLYTASQTAGNMGWAYQLIGDTETAAGFYTQAYELARRGGATTDQIRWMNQLGSLRRIELDFPGAARLQQEALAIARQHKHPQEMAEGLSNLADIAIETGRLADARRYNDEALAIKRKLKNVASELRSLMHEARLATAEGRTADAETILKRIIAESKETPLRWEAQYRLAANFIRASHNDRAEAAFRDALETVRDARRAVDANLRFSFFNLVDELFDAYVEFLIAAGRGDDALRVTEERRALTLEEGLKLPRSSRVLDATSIAKQKRATILCYSLGRTHSYVWIVTPKSTTVAPMPPAATINAAVDAYQRSLASSMGTLEATGARGRELYRLLIPAGAAIASGAHVIVIPDGRLHALNFETLVVPTPKPHYWIEDVVLVTAPSLQLLARNAPSSHAPKSMLIVGDVPQADPAFPRLKFAAAEIGNIAARVDGETVLSGAKATPSAYAKAEPGQYAQIHFVAHGVSTRQKPLDSAIILAPDGEHYKLFAREIIEHPLHARLVTISSCHGAGTRAYSGEGLVGLAWAFLHAGAEEVIAALWEVNDSATPRLMDQMYAGIRAGREPAVALRDAKLTLLRSRTVQQLPRYWAPFVLYSGT